MGIFLTVAGAVMVLSGLVDMFHTLLHPSGTGRISCLVLSGTWWMSKATAHSFGSVVGPAAMVAVVLVWVILQGLGWALIYLPHTPAGFAYSSGVDPSSYPDFIEALYVSFVTLSTLGFGDTVPTDPWIRAASPLEALTGFALLTAALAWFTQVYPPLSRHRVLALKLKGLAGVGYADKIAVLEATAVAQVLDLLSEDRGKTQVDFVQYTERFYFQEGDPALSLARQIDYALYLRDAALSSGGPAAQVSGQRLSLAPDQLAATLRNKFLSNARNIKDVFVAYAAEHGQD